MRRLDEIVFAGNWSGINDPPRRRAYGALDCEQCVDCERCPVCNRQREPVEDDLDGMEDAA